MFSFLQARRLCFIYIKKAIVKYSMFYHSGYPRSWTNIPRLYALYDLNHDCFLYVHHDLILVKKVKSLLSSKILTWVYELRLPMSNTPDSMITNANSVDYTLQPDMPRPDPVYYLSNGSKIVHTINCTEINILGEMTGIEFLPKTLTSDLKDLVAWTQFIAWVVNEIQSEEVFDDELISRALIADIHNRSQLPSNDMYTITSKIYQALLVEQDITEASHKIGELARQVKNANSVDINLVPYKRIASLYHYTHPK